MKEGLRTKTIAKKILIVDDEPAVCRMLEKFLTKKGYKASSVLSGEECLNKVKRQMPDAVLLDIRMPGMDGVEVLKRLRSFYKKMVIVMITAVKDDGVGRLCLELGADDYITKPLGLDYLENVLLVKLSGLNKRV